MSSLLVGPDGRARCAWSGDDVEYRRYHDEEWGTPLHGDRALFEKMALEGFQAGLSWITILRKRPRFREVFAGFDPRIVAEFGSDDVERLMADAGIIRNRAKILATISNAALVREMADGELDALMWSFAPTASVRSRPRELADVPAVTEQSAALSKALRKRGFRFVGPTTMYALMQSAGMVDDHVDGCWRAGAR
jgi:DNA-3-methyladenine glycosylase I